MIYKYTPEELLSQPETFEEMTRVIGKDMNHLYQLVRDFHSKSKNHKKNVYYHVVTQEQFGGGVGDGLYLGRDVEALIHFYGIDYDEGDIPLQVYRGNPNFLDLTNHNDFKVIKEESKKEFPNEENNNELREMTLKLGYDGIRYYDAVATGEEFVLYNIDKVKLIKTEMK